MKKVLAFLIASVLLIATFAIPTAAVDISPVTKYEDAKSGDLLYTVNFNGDDVFKPTTRQDLLSAENKPLNPTIMTYTPSEDGKSLHIKGIDGSANQENFWGGVIEGLDVNTSTVYAMVYQVKNDTPSGDSSLGFGGWIIDPETNKFYNNYSNANACGAQGKADNIQKSALSYGGQKLKAGYMYFGASETPYAVTEDGFMTFMVIYDGRDWTMKSYVLTENMGNGGMAEDWTLLQEGEMSNAGVEPNEKFGFFNYAFYAAIDAVVRDVKIYKGAPYSVPEIDNTTTAAPETSAVPETTPAPETSATPETTPAPETSAVPETTPSTPTTNAPTEAPNTTAKPDTTTAPSTNENKGGGCGGFTVAASFLAIVCAAGAAIVIKKK